MKEKSSNLPATLFHKVTDPKSEHYDYWALHPHGQRLSERKLTPAEQSFLQDAGFDVVYSITDEPFIEPINNLEPMQQKTWAVNLDSFGRINVRKIIYRVTPDSFGVEAPYRIAEANDRDLESESDLVNGLECAILSEPSLLKGLTSEGRIQVIASSPEWLKTVQLLKTKYGAAVNEFKDELFYVKPVN